jgi:hypothetical protein
MNKQRINYFTRILNKCMSERIIRKEKFNISKVKLYIQDYIIMQIFKRKNTK